MYKVIKDCLPIGKFIDLYQGVDPNLEHWVLNNPAYSGGHLSWGRNKESLETVFYDAATIIKYKVMRILKKPLVLGRIHCNGQTSGQICDFHTDYDDREAYTVILFSNLNWNSSWSGEFICLVDGEYKIAAYIPNHAVLIDASWQHTANCPNNKTDKLRTTVAFSYFVQDK